MPWTGERSTRPSGDRPARPVRSTRRRAPSNDTVAAMAIRDYLIVHYHEVGLKGGNRSLFERALVRNISRAASDLAELKPRRLPGRILVDLPNGVDVDQVAKRAGTVYGIANYARARGGQIGFDSICEIAGELMGTGEYETFAVRARIAHSTYPMSAREINEKLGAWLLEHNGKRVNLSDPDVTCYVEIVGDLVLVYVERRAGPGGLPVGTSGRVGVLLSAGLESPVAPPRHVRGLERGLSGSLRAIRAQKPGDESTLEGRGARGRAARHESDDRRGGRGR